MNTARNGRNTRNSTHRVFCTPDTEWSRKRSVKIWNKMMSQMNKKKNNKTDQKMSQTRRRRRPWRPPGTGESRAGQALDRGGDTPWGEEGSNLRMAGRVDTLHDQAAEADRRASRSAANHPQRVMRTAARGASLTAMVIALPAALPGPVISPLAVPAPLPSEAMP